MTDLERFQSSPEGLLHAGIHTVAAEIERWAKMAQRQDTREALDGEFSKLASLAISLNSVLYAVRPELRQAAE